MASKATKKKKAYQQNLPKFMKWEAGGCIVQILHRGHFPTTVVVATPKEVKMEVDISDLAYKKDGDGYDEVERSEFTRRDTL